jgi:hypothetical protein
MSAFRRSRPRMGRLARREALTCYAFIGLAVIGFLVFQAGPIGASAWLSFTDSELVGKPNFIGLGNYGEMLQDELFWQALKVTLVYALVTVPLALTVSLSLAILMNQKSVAWPSTAPSTISPRSSRAWQSPSYGAGSSTPSSACSTCCYAISGSRGRTGCKTRRPRCRR